MIAFVPDDGSGKMVRSQTNSQYRFLAEVWLPAADIWPAMEILDLLGT